MRTTLVPISHLFFPLQRVLLNLRKHASILQGVHQCFYTYRNIITFLHKFQKGPAFDTFDDFIFFEAQNLRTKNRGKGHILQKPKFNALKRLKEDLGMTIILVTHFMDEAVNADRVVVMNDGVVVFDGSPEEVFKNTEELKRIGLSVPKPLELALELKKEGYDLGTKVLTEDSFLEAFKKLQ